MFNTKLVLVEGIPGSGKNTITEYAFNIFLRSGQNCKAFYERTENHPTVVDDEAWFMSNKREGII